MVTLFPSTEPTQSPAGDQTWSRLAGAVAFEASSDPFDDFEDEFDDDFEEEWDDDEEDDGFGAEYQDDEEDDGDEFPDDPEFDE